VNNIQSFNLNNLNNRMFLNKEIPDKIIHNNKNDKEQVDNIKSMFDKLMVDINN
jgi:hypothetical protein